MEELDKKHVIKEGKALGGYGCFEKFCKMTRNPERQGFAKRHVNKEALSWRVTCVSESLVKTHVIIDGKILLVTCILEDFTNSHVISIKK